MPKHPPHQGDDPRKDAPPPEEPCHDGPARRQPDVAPVPADVPDDPIGVLSPYALTELVLGRRVNWRRVRKGRRLMEAALGHRYEDLFDPERDSPLFPGQRVHELIQQMAEPEQLTLELRARLGEFHCTIRGLFVTHDPRELARARALAFGDPASDERVEAGASWNPTDVAWRDVGDVSGWGTEGWDPVQGSLGDCYLLAALSAVAWTRPELLAPVTKLWSGVTWDDVGFYDATFIRRVVSVSEQVPTTSASALLIYARSSEAMEIWPAVYEKAYAKWKTGTTSDRPDYRAITGGSPATALGELIGHAPERVDCAAVSENDLWGYIVEYCRADRRAWVPMVTWTWPSGTAGVSYKDANLVASHAYTVMGWEEWAGKRYVIVRNPYGWRDTTAPSLAGTWEALRTAWWKPYDDVDAGLLAVPLSDFRKLFRRIAATP